MFQLHRSTLHCLTGNSKVPPFYIHFPQSRIRATVISQYCKTQNVCHKWPWAITLTSYSRSWAPLGTASLRPKLRVEWEMSESWCKCKCPERHWSIEAVSFHAWNEYRGAGSWVSTLESSSEMLGELGRGWMNWDPQTFETEVLTFPACSSSLSFSTSLPPKTVLLYDMCLLTFTSCNLYIWEKYSVIITELL